MRWRQQKANRRLDGRVVSLAEAPEEGSLDELEPHSSARHDCVDVLLGKAQQEERVCAGAS